MRACGVMMLVAQVPLHGSATPIFFTPRLLQPTIVHDARALKWACCISFLVFTFRGGRSVPVVGSTPRYAFHDAQAGLEISAGQARRCLKMYINVNMQETRACAFWLASDEHCEVTLALFNTFHLNYPCGLMHCISLTVG